MATGIVSVAGHEQGLLLVSDALLGIGCLAWLALTAGLLRRARERCRPQLQSFALVAATAVLGARFTLSGENAIALTSWSLASFCGLLLLVHRPVLANPEGGSLLVVVATESLGVLSALLAGPWSRSFLVFALVAWTAGLTLYPIVAATIVRALRARARFAPDLWIVMGALAIATLAGTELLRETRALHTLHGLQRSLPDIDLATWALATALVVPLVVAELRSRSEWRYAGGRWSFVFPLGMYSVASRTLGHTERIAALDAIGRAFFVVSVAAWTLTAVGLIRTVLTKRRR